VAYYGRHLETSRHPVVKAVAVSMVLVLTVLTGTAYLIYRHLQGNVTVSQAFEQLGDRPDEVEVEGPKDPLNIMILGSDTRAGQSAVAGSTPGLSDTTILLHLSADRERAYGVSLPRDAMVQRPDCYEEDGTVIPGELSMFNAAYAAGGPACTQRTVEQLTGIRVDHFVVVDFRGFKHMVDALGGVEICVPEEVDDEKGNIYLRKGTYEADGDQALDYVRVRQVISNNGDIGRMRRQQAFLASMANKAISAGTLANPPKLYSFLDAATNSITTDPGLSSLKTLVGLANELRGIGLENIQFLTVPWEWYEPDPNRVVWSEEAKPLWKRLQKDLELTPKQAAGVIAAANPPSGRKPSGGPEPSGSATPSESPSASPSESASPSATPTGSVSAEEARENGLCT